MESSIPNGKLSADNFQSGVRIGASSFNTMVKVKADGTFYTNGDDGIIVQNFADGLRVWFDGEWRKPSAAFVGKDLNDNDIAMVIVGNRNLLFNHNLEFAQVRADIASWVEKRDANSMLPVIKVENGQVYVDGTLSTDVSDRYRSGVQVGGSSSNRMVKVHSDKSLHVDGAGRVEVKYVPGEGVKYLYDRVWWSSSAAYTGTDAEGNRIAIVTIQNKNLMVNYNPDHDQFYNLVVTDVGLHGGNSPTWIHKGRHGRQGSTWRPRHPSSLRWPGRDGSGERRGPARQGARKHPPENGAAGRVTRPCDAV